MNRELSAEAGDAVFAGGEIKATVVGPNRMDVNDWNRGKSNGKRLDNGRFSLEVLERPHRGKAGERYVLSELPAMFRAHAGIDVAIRPSTDEEDAWGEDGRIVIADRELVVQIVTAPTSEEWGRLCASGRAVVEFSADEGAEWILGAILKKERTYADSKDRAGMLLALDARHAGILGHEDIIGAFRRQNPGWAGSGFNQVWLVAPAPEYCRRLWPVST